MKTDVVILGAGPVGLFAAFYAGMRDLNSIIVDQLEVPGGQLMALYPEKEIYDVAGFKSIKAKDLVKNLIEQLDRFEEKVNYSLNNQMTNIVKQEDGSFVVETINGNIECSSVIIAGGNGGFSPRKLGIENEDEFDIDYFIKDKNKYQDKKVIIFGGGDSAVDFSLMLENIASEVSIVHRRDEFRAHDHSVELLKNSSVNIYTPYTPVKVEKENGLNKVFIKNKEEEKVVEVDNIICNFGFISKLGPIENFGIDIEKNKIVVDTKQQTSIDGIFAIGDICTYDGKANLIISGFGEAPIAVNQAYMHQFPDKVLKTLHSTSIIK